MSSLTKDLRPYINTLFPPLPDGREPLGVLMDKRNFTTETLTYMTPTARGKIITDSVMSRYTTLEPVAGTEDQYTVVYPKDPALLIEICAGIGGLTLSLAADPRIGMIMSFEPRKDRQLMFKRNMMTYGVGNKVILVESPFNIQANIAPFQGAIGYIDPPWLPEDISGDQMTGKNQYILEGISLKDETGASFTLEEVLAYVTNILYLVVIQVPPKYKLKTVPGWVYEVEDIITKGGTHSSTMYYCTCTELRPFLDQLHSGMGPYYGQDISSYTVAGSFVDPDPIKNPIPAPIKTTLGMTSVIQASTVTAPVVTLGSAIKPKPVNVKIAPKPKGKYKNVNEDDDSDSFAKILWSPSDIDFDNSTIPIPTGRNVVGSAEWVLEFQNYINELLKIVIKDDVQRNKLLDPQYMPIWIRAWTHETYNADSMQNYERLETQGDGLLTYAFRDYVSERLPDATSAQLSEYKARYMSKEIQPLLSKQLKMGQWLLADGVDMALDDNVHIHEDLFESFFGAITIIMRTINRGKESIIAYNYIVKFFAKTTFDERIVRGKPKTIIVQYGNRFNWELPVEQIQEINAHRHVATIDFSPTGLDFIRAKSGINLTNPIGKAEAGSAKLARAKAYESALKRLDDSGLTHEWFVAERTKLTFAQFDPALVSRVIKKVHDKFKLDTIKFVTPKSTSTQHYKIIQLIGSSEINKRKVVLASIRTTSEEDGKRQVLELFDKDN
jgi:dsRNA-specific ribonuclease